MFGDIMRKILFFILLVLVCSSSLFAVDSTHISVDYSIANKKATFDSMYFEIRLKEVKLENEKQNNELKAEINDNEKRAIESDKTTIGLYSNLISMFFGFLAIFVPVMIFIISRYDSSRRESENKINKALLEIKDSQLKEIKTHLRNLTILANKTIKESGVDKNILDDLNKLEETADSKVNKEENKPKFKISDETLKSIDVDDAENAIKAYEKLLFDIEVQGLSKSIIPVSLRKKLGNNYLKLSNYNSAKNEFEIYLTHYPKDLESLENVAFLNYNEKDFDKCNQISAIIAKYYPENALNYYNWAVSLGDSYLNKHDYSLLIKAISLLKLSIKYNPLYASAYFNWGCYLGELFKKDTDYSYLEEAIKKYEKTTVLNPKHNGAFTNWALALSSLFVRDNQYSYLTKAVEKLKKAIEIIPENYHAYYSWGQVLIIQYKHDNNPSHLEEAITRFSKANELSPHHPKRDTVYFDIACAYALFENHELMLVNLEKAISLDSANKKRALEDEDFDFYKKDDAFIALTKEDDDEKADENPNEES